jgi:hypothetical protein
VLEYDTIVELGAGIGEVPRLILDRGFAGRYYIIDFPEVAKISSFYLDNRAIFVDNIDQICDIDSTKTLFIATWSLSEVPIEYRNHIGNKLLGCDSLIAFQGKFKDIENPGYFLNVWPFVNNCFYRLRQIEFHQSDGGNCYFICKGMKNAHEGNGI